MQSVDVNPQNVLASMYKALKGQGGPGGPRDKEAAGNVVRGTTFVKLGLSVIFRLPRLILTAVINIYATIIHNRVGGN